MMATPHYQRFLDSMNIGYEQWHDGTGYDLEALAALTPEDRSAAEAVLTTHLANPGDWRDVEALSAIHTPSAAAAVRAAAKHRNPDVRNWVLENPPRPPNWKTISYAPWNMAPSILRRAIRPLA
jgi:hypothetical protein